MGLLIDGQWHANPEEQKNKDGRFVRAESQFRNWITPDGKNPPSGKNGFKAEKGRYHLYASYACPWVHRVLLYIALKGLNDFVDVSFAHWHMADQGWTFTPTEDGIAGDKLFNFDYSHQLYTKADPNYSGRATVPILWDKHTDTIVSNESADIIRMLNSAFDSAGAIDGDFYPPHLQNDIDDMNDFIYNAINNGVYKCGFATTQGAYDEAVKSLFSGLDKVEATLSKQRFLCGDAPTEADWRLFPTLYRFDSVYVHHFKCSKKRIMDYPNIWGYARDLYQWGPVKHTVNMDHVRKHYYVSHTQINPLGIIPEMPDIDWNGPHNRG